MASHVSLSNSSVEKMINFWYGDSYALVYFLKQHDAGAIIFFSINPDGSYPIFDVKCCDRVNDNQWRIVINGPGLFGSFGSLPNFDQSTLINSGKLIRQSMTDFFDIFHHRLFHWSYVSWNQMRPSLNNSCNDNTNVCYSRCHLFRHYNRFIQCISGLRGEYNSLISFLSTHLAIVPSRNVSPQVIVRLIKQFFSLPVSISTFVQDFYLLRKDQQTCLSQKGVNACLGRTVVLGQKVIILTSRIIIHIGPLDSIQFTRLLPGSPVVDQLQTMLMLLVDQRMTIDVCLIIKNSQILMLKLDLTFQGRLGFNIWLGCRSGRKDSSDLRFTLNTKH